MTKNNNETPSKPRPITDAREVINMRDVNDPRVIKAVEEILAAEWAEEGAEFDYEIE